MEGNQPLSPHPPSPRKPSPHRLKAEIGPQAPARLHEKFRSRRERVGKGQLLDDPAVMRTVEGPPSLKVWLRCVCVKSLNLITPQWWWILIGQKVLINLVWFVYLWFRVWTVLLWTVDAVQAGGISTPTWLAASFFPFHMHVYIRTIYTHSLFLFCSCFFSNMTHCKVPHRLFLTAM